MACAAARISMLAAWWLRRCLYDEVGRTTAPLLPPAPGVGARSCLLLARLSRLRARAVPLFAPPPSLAAAPAFAPPCPAASSLGRSWSRVTVAAAGGCARAARGAGGRAARGAARTGGTAASWWSLLAPRAESSESLVLLVAGCVLPVRVAWQWLMPPPPCSCLGGLRVARLGGCWGSAALRRTSRRQEDGERARSRPPEEERRGRPGARVLPGGGRRYC